MTEQVFTSSTIPGDSVVDVLINEAISNFTLTLTGYDTSSTLSQSPFGAFTLFTAKPAFTKQPCDTNTNPGDTSGGQCGPAPDSQLAAGSPTANSVLDQVTFDVTGTNQGGDKGFVFFEIAPSGGKVSAVITPNPVTTPEPALLPILGVALLAMLAFKRRRLTLR